MTKYKENFLVSRHKDYVLCEKIMQKSKTIFSLLPIYYYALEQSIKYI